MLGFSVMSENLGKTYTLTHSNCDGELQVVIPLNVLLLAREIPEESSFFEDAMKDLIDLVGKAKKAR